jgi:hypothetical protein
MQLVSVAEAGVPKFGVVRVGVFCITKVEPVPVCAATVVAFPVDVIGPVRFAFVTVRSAVPQVAALRFGTTVVDVTVKGGVPIVTVDTKEFAVKLLELSTVTPVPVPPIDCCAAGCAGGVYPTG